jgi:nicotinate-nucleotide adenylyltransferase
MTSRIGILGGTFDPVHVGHLVLAEQARVQLALDRVLFLPAAVPPHKQHLAITNAKTRLDMLSIAVGGNPAFEISTVEIDRAGVSYTIDTLESLQSQNPDSELWLIVGADTINDVPNWRRPDDVVQIAFFGVAGRPGFPLSPPASLPKLRLSPIQMPLLEVSSTYLRAQVASGGSVRYLIPAGVEAFIRAQQLYRS